MFKSPKQHHLLDRPEKEGKEHVKNDLYYAEDFKEGETFNLGTYSVTRKEIIDFAEKYDPFPFHVDEAKAKETISMIINMDFGLFGTPTVINNLKDFLKRILKIPYGQLGMQINKQEKQVVF